MPFRVWLTNPLEKNLHGHDLSPPVVRLRVPFSVDFRGELGDLAINNFSPRLRQGQPPAVGQAALELGEGLEAANPAALKAAVHLADELKAKT